GKGADDRRGLYRPRRRVEAFEVRGTAKRDRRDRRGAFAWRSFGKRGVSRREGTPGLDRRPYRRDRGQDGARPGDRRLETVREPGEIRRDRQRRRRGYRGRGPLPDRRRARGRREIRQALGHLAVGA